MRGFLVSEEFAASFSFQANKVADFFRHFEILTSSSFFETRAFEEMLRFLKEQLEIC